MSDPTITLPAVVVKSAAKSCLQKKQHEKDALYEALKLRVGDDYNKHVEKFNSAGKFIKKLRAWFTYSDPLNFNQFAAGYKPSNRTWYRYNEWDSPYNPEFKNWYNHHIWEESTIRELSLIQSVNQTVTLDVELWNHIQRNQ